MVHTSSQSSLLARFAFLIIALTADRSGLYARENPVPVAMPLVSAAPIVGAIRWDAWYGNGAVTQAVEKTLGQPKYHFRLPWFAQLLGNDKVRINGNSDEVMAQELTYAADAGLSYWAFLNYWEESPDLGVGLRRYLAARNKRGIHYCLLEEGARLDKIGRSVLPKLIAHFKSPDYQTVLGGRPLLFVYVKPEVLGRNIWEELRSQALDAGLKTPYLVLMGWNPEKDASDMVELGFDAISAYARGGSYSMEHSSFTEQSRMLKQTLWEKWQKLGVPFVTLASAGWDTRPRNERPPFWIENLVVQPSPDIAPTLEQEPLIDSVTASPEQLQAHILEALEWTKSHRALNPSNAVIVYAWNEHDEGGWLQPTRGNSGLPNEERIKALSDILLPRKKASKP